MCVRCSWSSESSAVSALAATCASACRVVLASKSHDTRSMAVTHHLKAAAACRGLRRIAGHTFESLLAFGGCKPTILGIMPVAKLDLMLIGEART